MGDLVPIGITEVLPGDSIQHATNGLIRAAPLLSPVMHPVNCSITHWYVPYRLIWDEFEDFITGGPDGANASVYPTINTPVSTGFAVGSLADHLGIPPGVASRPVSALPFRAYALIYNEWFRDQDLVTELTIDKTSGADTTTNVLMQQGAWEKDYFTSARPWEQKGPAITIPLGTTAPVVARVNPGVNDPAIIRVASSGAGVGSVDLYTNASSQLTNSTNTAPYYLDPNGGLVTDLTGASAISLNVLREAAALQRFEEARARYGSRYTEYLNYLGVQSSDARLQRPEYLAGGKETIQFSEVLQTGEGTDPVGTLRGHGISAMRSNRYRRFFEEHGIIVTLFTARPKTIYASGLERLWNRRNKEDFWQRELEHIGQQPIQNKEVYFNHTTPDGTFGYQDRYDEYRRNWSRIAGEFRTTLDFWHFARIFGSNPALNADFVKCVPTEDPFAVPAENTLQVMSRHSMQARRLVAKKGTSFLF